MFREMPIIRIPVAILGNAPSRRHKKTQEDTRTGKQEVYTSKVREEAEGAKVKGGAFEWRFAPLYAEE